MPSEMGQIWSQMKPPAPVFTEKQCPDQTNKVFIVTGGYSGVGFELTKILYSKNATIYIAGRDQKKGLQSIVDAKKAVSASRGRLEFLPLDLGDLTTIKKAADTFLEKETRLDVLWNNAGVMTPPAGSKTKQGYELQLGTNCLGHFLFTKLLHPILAQTAATSPPNSVRVCFTGSLVAELSVPKGVINFDDINHEKGGSSGEIYGQSKAANILLGHEFARRFQHEGIISVSLNPGNLKSPLQRNQSSYGKLFNWLLLFPPIFGAYTELFAGLSPDVTSDRNGSYIIPWGRFAVLKKNLAEAAKSKAEGGTGVASRFWDWCEGEVIPYV